MIPDSEKVKALDFKEVNINDNKWLSYSIKKHPADPDKISYVLPITENRYLQIAFYIMKGDDKDRDNWYQTCKSDIEKIINTFRVTFPQ